MKKIIINNVQILFYILTTCYVCRQNIVFQEEIRKDVEDDGVGVWGL